MNYEQKYKEALERVRIILTDRDIALHAKEKFIDIFPELKESEGERIRKEIIQYIKIGTYHKDWVTWLEKQRHMLDPDKVIEWLECKAFQGWGEPIDIRPIIRKFKKDFEL